MKPEIIFCCIAIPAILIFFAYLIIRESKYEKQKREQTAAEIDNTVGETAEAEPVAVGARVLRKELYGRHTVRFGVTFLTDEGEEKDYTVSEKLYNALAVDQTGMLVTINGYFLDFGDGEDVPDEEMTEESKEMLEEENVEDDLFANEEG